MKVTEINLSAATVLELAEGRTQAINSAGDLTSLEIRYKVSNLPAASGMTLTVGGKEESVTSDLLALEAVRRETPESLYGLPRSDIKLDRRIDEATALVQVLYKTFSVSASLGSDTDDDSSGDPESNVGQISFECSQETVHVTRALGPGVAFGNVPPNPGYAINVASDGSVGGLDITSSVITMTETRYLSRRKFTSAYLRMVSSLANHINKAPFRGFQAGEVRFDGIQSSRPLSGRNARYTVTYRFSIQYNEPARLINGFRVPAKRGWDYTWFMHAPALASSNGQNFITQPIIGGYTQPVYETGDFDLLKLPSGVIS